MLVFSRDALTILHTHSKETLTCLKLVMCALLHADAEAEGGAVQQLSRGSRD